MKWLPILALATMTLSFNGVCYAQANHRETVTDGSAPTTDGIRWQSMLETFKQGKRSSFQTKDHPETEAANVTLYLPEELSLNTDLSPLGKIIVFTEPSGGLLFEIEVGAMPSASSQMQKLYEDGYFDDKSKIISLLKNELPPNSDILSADIKKINHHFALAIRYKSLLVLDSDKKEMPALTYSTVLVTDNAFVRITGTLLWIDGPGIAGSVDAFQNLYDEIINRTKIHDSNSQNKISDPVPEKPEYSPPVYIKKTNGNFFLDLLQHLLAFSIFAIILFFVGWLCSLFTRKPSEIKKTIDIIRQLTHQYPYSCNEQVYSASLQAAKSQEINLVNVIKNGIANMEHVAMDVVLQVLSSHLASGQYHIYRGILSMRGHEMKKMYRTMYEQCVAKGYCSSETAEENMAYVESEIKTVG